MLTEQNSASVVHGGAGKPWIVTDLPAETTAASGSNVSLGTYARAQPNPTVQWQVSTDDGDTWADIEGATDPTYVIESAADEDGNQYRAVYSTAGGSLTTGVTTLNLTPIMGTSIRAHADTPRPTITGTH